MTNATRRLDAATVAQYIRVLSEVRAKLLALPRHVRFANDLGIEVGQLDFVIRDLLRTSLTDVEVETVKGELG